MRHSGGNRRVAGPSSSTVPANNVVTLKGTIFGLTLSNGTDSDHDIDVTAGQASDNSDGTLMVLSAAITKQIDAAWAVGDDQGGLDTGTVTTSTWYAVWLIMRSDTGVVDALFSTSATSPTMPTNYDKKRRIGWVLTNGSSNITAFYHAGGDHFEWDVPVSDMAGGTATTQTAITLSAPPNSRAQFVISASEANGGGQNLIFTRIGQTDTAPSATHFHIQSLDNGNASGTAGRSTVAVDFEVDASSQLNYRSSGNTGDTDLITHGWKDDRGRYA